MANIFDDFLKRVAEAEEEAILKGIDANTIILNSNNAYVKEFYINRVMGLDRSLIKIEPMILGKKMILGPLPENYDFALLNVKRKPNKIETIEGLESETGIDSVVLLKAIKALKTGIKCPDGDSWDGNELNLDIEEKALVCHVGGEYPMDFTFPFDLYGKTWALTWQELNL